MNDLPDDVLRLIFERCSATTLASLECVSKRFLRLVKSVDSLRVHITPRCIPSDAWIDAHKDKITRISMRRTFPNVFSAYFPRVTVVDIMYTTVRFWNAPQFCSIPHLQKLRVCTLYRRFGQPDVFQTSMLPSSLQDVFLSFDDTWRRIDIDQSFPRLAIRCHEGRVLFRQPDFHVTNIEKCQELYLKTFGCITTSVTTPAGITKAVIESEDNFIARNILKWFDSRLETCVFRFPASSFVFSQDFEFIHPVSMELVGSFVAVDVINPKLRNLKIRCRRLASIAIPSHVDTDIDVDRVNMSNFIL